MRLCEDDQDGRDYLVAQGDRTLILLELASTLFKFPPEIASDLQRARQALEMDEEHIHVACMQAF